MARSIESRVLLRRVIPLFGAFALVACSDVPSKGEALEIVQREVKEEASCTLPVSLLSRFKIQYTTKAICVPREGGPASDAAMACLDALVAAGATKRMPGGYMAEWPDEVANAGFDTVSPYERRARALIFKGCVELGSDLREGRFRCGQAQAERVVKVSKKEESLASVRYARAITLDPQLAAIEAACGAVTRPAPEGTVMLEKRDKQWGLASGDTAPAAPSASKP